MHRVEKVGGRYLPTLIKAVVTVAVIFLVVTGLSPRVPGIPRRLKGSWRSLALNRPVGSPLLAPAGTPSAPPVAQSAAGSGPPAPGGSVQAAYGPPQTPLPPPLASQPLSAPGSSPPDIAGECQAALAYLAAHAAPGFVASCPHYAGGHQAATTCVGAPDCTPGSEFIWIADPCPAAYMNEASNSWVLTGQSAAPWDPYGYCGEPGNPYG
jgi:hypothetical protein